METMNWDDVVETSYVNEAGKYTFTVKSVAKNADGEITQKCSTGTPFHRFVCETEDGEIINLSLYLAPKALWKYKAFLKALGENPQGEIKDYDELAKSVIGKQFVGEVKKCDPQLNVATGAIEESKYYEIYKFYPVA